MALLLQAEDQRGAFLLLVSDLPVDSLRGSPCARPDRGSSCRRPFLLQGCRALPSGGRCRGWSRASCGVRAPTKGPGRGGCAPSLSSMPCNFLSSKKVTRYTHYVDMIIPMPWSPPPAAIEEWDFVESVLLASLGALPSALSSRSAGTKPGLPIWVGLGPKPVEE